MAGKLDSKPSSSVFHLPSNFFHAFRLVLDLEDDDQSRPSPSDSSHGLPGHVPEASVSGLGLGLGLESNGKQGMRRWSCNTCKSEFESLEEQRSHFKSDIHRFNVKLSLAGKSTVKEEDFDELVGDSMSRDYEVSSISGSEDEGEKEPSPNAGTFDGLGKGERTKQRIFTILNSGETISIWKCLLLGDHEDLSYEKNKSISPENVWCAKSLGEDELINKLQHLVCEPRNKTHLRIVLLASGGHFAGCVFDGDSIVAHKTFHRYVVRAKSGKKQSSKDGTGKASKSAGASLRRYNELALKKEVQELLASWKPYFDASVCIFVHAPSNNRQLLYDGENSIFVIFEHLIRRVPVTVRRPTLKEARRVYSQLTHIIYVTEDQRAENDTKEKESTEEKTVSCEEISGHTENTGNCEAPIDIKYLEGSTSVKNQVVDTSISNNVSNGEPELTPLHEAASSGNVQKTLELLELGCDPCIRDSRGRTPYMMATDKEVRNNFRRFMALNLDKWDWHAANVPSPLTKEMEESQAAKQSEKDAKRKARSKELKKLRKAKEKAQAQAPSAAPPQISTVSDGHMVVSMPQHKGVNALVSSSGAKLSQEEELKREREIEREKRAAAAEKRIAAQKGALVTSSTAIPDSSLGAKGMMSDEKCSCCMASLAGKIPFHRYNYKYCSCSCMHVHREILEDG